MPRLTVEKGPEKGKTLFLAKSSILIGRDPASSLRITDTLASRIHFRIEPRLDGFWLVDQESMNGTYVNGERIKERKLTLGDKVQVGETLFSFLADGGETKSGEQLSPLLKRGYRVETRIGRGGMGTVYKALQVSLNRVVALKILSPELIRDRNFISLFIQEARACAQLNHPNIVQVYDVGKEEDIYFFSMEYLPGGSVQEVLGKEKKLPPKRAVEVAYDAARGLEYAERKQIVHRDIKPDNLMIGEDAVIKIGDLGLATSLKDRAKNDSGVIFGTPHYIAPEQFLGKDVDHRADIYSLGASLYRMLCGNTPYSGNNVREILLKKVREEPPALAGLEPGLPPRLVQVTEKMMKKDPNERYQSASQLLPDLEALKRDLNGQSVAVSAPIEAPTTPSLVLPELHKTARSSWLGYLALALVAAAIAVGTFLVLAKLLPKKPTGTQTPATDPSYERLARNLFDTAREAEGNMDPDDEGAYAGVIAKYQKVKKETPQSPRVADADKRIAKLEHDLAQLHERDAAEKRETDAQRAYAEACRAVKELKDKTGGPPAPAILESCIARMKEVGTQFPDTKAAAQAGEDVKVLESVKKEFEAGAAALDQAERDVTRLLGQKNYLEAWTSYDAIARDPKLKRFGPRIDELHATLDKACNAAVNEVLGQADELVRDNKPDEALRALDDFLAGKVHPGQVNQVTERRRQIKADRDRAAEQALAEKRQQEKEAALDELAQAVLAAARRDYAAVEHGLAQLTGSLSQADVKAKVEIRKRDYAAERAVFEEFLRRAAQAGDRVKGLKETSLAIGDNRYRVLGATAREIILQYEGLAAQTRQKWEDVPVPVLVTFLRNAWGHTGQEHLGIGILALRHGLTKDALAEFKLAADPKQGDPGLANLAQAYADRSDPKDSPAEEDAGLLWSAAGHLGDKDRFRDAIPLLERLEKDYTETQAYQERAEQVRKALVEARKRAK